MRAEGGPSQAQASSRVLVLEWEMGRNQHVSIPLQQMANMKGRGKIPRFQLNLQSRSHNVRTEMNILCEKRL